MADPEKPPIPRDLAEAFHNAVAELRGWTLGGKEPQVSSAYDDPVPERVQTVLLDMRIELPP
jgi:hypothetical protein